MLTLKSEHNPLTKRVFIPGDEVAYKTWRDARLADYSQNAGVVVPVANLSRPTDMEVKRIVNLCRRTNFAIYESLQPEGPDAETILRRDLIDFCSVFGLSSQEDHRSGGVYGFVPLEVSKTDSRSGYIPYTDRPLSWHTDGYYNNETDRIRAMVLHCVRDARAGGYNELLDYEIAYIRLRDENPDFITALMHAEAMTIPENTDPRSAYRPASTGPVFYLDEASGGLSMRYTARSRNIEWRDDPVTSDARAFLSEVLETDPLIVRHRLEPGQGVISNNILHNRTGFEDADEAGATRLLYRARFRDRISGT